MRVPSLSVDGVTFHVPSDCTSAVRACAPTVTWTIVPVATSLVPSIVGVASFVITDGPPSMRHERQHGVDGQLLGGAAGVACSVDDRGDDG